MTLADRLAQARRDRDALEAGDSSDVLVGFRRNGRAVDPFDELKRTVHQSLLENLGPKLYDSRLSQGELEQKVRLTLQEVLAQEDTPLTIADRTRIAQEVADDILGYGPLEPFLRDVDVTEVMVNGPDRIYIERAGRIHPVPGRFTDEGRLRRTIDKIVDEWAAGSTRRAQCATRGYPMAAGSTRSSLPSPSTAPCSPSGSSRPTRTSPRTW